MVFCCARVLRVLRSPLLDNLMLMLSCGLFFQLYSFHKSGFVGSYCFLPDTVSNSYLSRVCNSLRDHVLYCLAEIKKRDNDHHLICIVWGITLQLLQVLSEMLVVFFPLPREKGWMLERQLEENFLSYFRLHFARLKSIQ